ncbi:MAG: hypothetical protein V1835_06165 [Candidatus Micrarchaeota archaeon]
MAKGGKKSSGISAMHIMLGAVIILALILIANNPSITGMFTATKQVATPSPTDEPFKMLPSPTPLAVTDYPPELYARLQAYQSGIEAISVRPRYFGSITDEIFKELPPFPKDFYVIKLLFELGKITDPGKVTADYWKQPEFYRGFDSQGVKMMANPPQGRWGAFGLGTYPGETVVLAPKQSEFETRFFIHTSWLVQTYQGMGLYSVFPKSGSLQSTSYPDDTKAVQQDPETIKQYFDVTVTPDVVLLEPAFPIFKEGWTQMVTVKVRVKNPPSGKYLIGINSGSPPSGKATEWLWKYKTNYVGGGSSSIGVPWYTIFIQV